ncbi:class I SAM-dependent methyltransferase, partial [Deinococcus pimensis]|uniref:class I SAM-dependent methyltransferase n=1 Tax=Deinococcus pimensis TaxID=309888 RepID=UPI0005EB11D7
GRLLELGSGGGQFAVAAAMLGHDVTALELRDAGTRHALDLAARYGVRLHAVTGSFYDAELEGPFEAVCYLDGFGIGSDADQRLLLGRIAGWLAPRGLAFVDVYTPWYWAQHAGFTRETDRYRQTYGFDADACALLDTYERLDGSGEAGTQVLRCYGPADLRLLALGTGLGVIEVWPGGRLDTSTLTWHPRAPLGACLSYTAVLGRTTG